MEAVQSFNFISIPYHGMSVKRLQALHCLRETGFTLYKATFLCYILNNRLKRFQNSSLHHVQGGTAYALLHLVVIVDSDVAKPLARKT